MASMSSQALLQSYFVLLTTQDSSTKLRSNRINITEKRHFPELVIDSKESESSPTAQSHKVSHDFPEDYGSVCAHEIQHVNTAYV